MRDPIDVHYLRGTEWVKRRGTCARRQVAAIATNHRHHVLAVGFNGVPSGLPHCRGGALCAGARALSGTALDLCLAVHAEANMLAQCRDVWEIDTVYLTCSPCFNCTKSLISSSCRRLVFLQEYPHPEAGTLWRSTGRDWILSSPLPTIELEGSFY